MNVKSFLLGAACCALVTGAVSLASAGMGLGGAGAVQFEGKNDIKESPYFKQVDVYNMKSKGSLVVLSNFKTMQQTTDYSCGPAAAYMVVQHLNGQPLHKELEIAKIMKTSTTCGTDLPSMVKYFKHIGWQTDSKLTQGSPKSYEDFTQMVKKYLNAGTPIIVENVDWGGHWRVIIGFDDMGTPYEGDDVLLMADPYDTTDHNQDGYNIVPSCRFYYMWFDAHLMKDKGKLWLAPRPNK